MGNLVLSAKATSTLLVAFLFFGQIGRNRQWQGERYPLHTTPKKTKRNLKIRLRSLYSFQ